MKTRVRIPRWLAKANGLPRVADVEISKRTAKAVLASGHGAVESPVQCCICGRELTHPISQQVGIGPVCAPRVGVDWSADTSPEAIAAFKATLMEATTFTDVWLPLSQVTFETPTDLTDLPRHRRDDDDGFSKSDAPPNDSRPPLPEFRVGQVAHIFPTEWIAGQKAHYGDHERGFMGLVKAVSEKAVNIAGMGTESSGTEWWPKSQIVKAEIVTDVADVQDDEPQEVDVKRAVKGRRPFRPTVGSDKDAVPIAEFFGEAPPEQRLQGETEYSRFSDSKLPF